MTIIRIGIDLAKNVFQVHGVNANEQVVCTRKLRREQVLDFFKKLPPCQVGMEACGGAHHWARELQTLGHTVLMMAPQHVKPYVQGNKNDANDAAAICEAMTRERMRFVPVKSVEQQDLQALHRIRSELIQQRTAKVNQIRGLLTERGIVVPLQVAMLRRQLPMLLDDHDTRLTAHFRAQLRGLREDLVHLDERVASVDRDIQHMGREHAQARKLQQLRGIGPITATALVAAIGQHIGDFKHARDLAAWLGLVPGQHGSGGKAKLLGISKRGDTYLRTLLIHGARAVVLAAQGKTDRLSVWIQKLCHRRNRNVAAVALANKTARLAWALLTREADYDPEYGQAGLDMAS